MKIFLLSFSPIIKARFLEFSDIVKECSSKLTKATLEVFEWVQENLAPMPAKFHYIYSMRDVSHIYEGICSVQPTKVNSAIILVKLWHHEVSRVLFNRLVMEEDQFSANEKVESIILQIFPETSVASLKKPLVFSDFQHILKRTSRAGAVDHLYCDLGDFSVVHKIFNEVMENHNKADNLKLEIVLFDMALCHIVQLMLIFRAPRGHALLIGIGGSGKRSLTELASFANGYRIFELNITTSYREANFQDELRELYMKLTLGPVIFLFSDSQKVQERFLKYAGAGLLVWVLAILRYYEVFQQVEPLREHVKTMEKAQLKTESELLQLRHLLKELNIELINLNEAYVETANSYLSSRRKQRY
jgi:dynein heavy chain